MERAYRQAARAFDGLLGALAEELPRLRRPVDGELPAFRGPVARRMAEAVWPHRAVFITPMAAVAGAIADHLLAAMVEGRQLERAYVNDGGDIAIHLAPGAEIRMGMVAEIEQPRLNGTIRITHADPVRGIATSGQGGRSFSLGIADAVTVLSGNAAAADAAATLIANAVNLDHPAIQRAPASGLDPDSDLGDRLVTVAVGPLDPVSTALALAAGLIVAERMRERGLIAAAALWLQGEVRLCGSFPGLPPLPLPQSAV